MMAIELRWLHAPVSVVLVLQFRVRVQQAFRVLLLLGQGLQALHLLQRQHARLAQQLSTHMAVLIRTRSPPAALR